MLEGLAELDSAVGAVVAAAAVDITAADITDKPRFESMSCEIGLRIQPVELH